MSTGFDSLTAIELRLTSNHGQYKVNGLGCGLSVESDRNMEQMEPRVGGIFAWWIPLYRVVQMADSPICTTIGLLCIIH